MNDQLDENDVQEHRPNHHVDAENELNVDENNAEDGEVAEDEMENQEENIEPEIAEIEANANEIQMEPVNVDQPDDNQNDLFNEVKTTNSSVQNFWK